MELEHACTSLGGNPFQFLQATMKELPVFQLQFQNEAVLTGNPTLKHYLGNLYLVARVINAVLQFRSLSVFCFYPSGLHAGRPTLNAWVLRPSGAKWPTHPLPQGPGIIEFQLPERNMANHCRTPASRILKFSQRVLNVWRPTNRDCKWGKFFAWHNSFSPLITPGKRDNIY